MKKLNYLLLAVMTILFAASCSQDETLSVESGDASTVTFTVDVPESGPQSRAIGDGKTVDKLVYAIYENGEIVSNLGGDNTAGFPQTLTLSLLKDKTYEIAFWAQSSECEAYGTDNLKNVTVSYNDALNNDESRDAFFKTIKHEVAGNASVAVELERPFAQINVGASDWEEAVAAGFTVEKSKVKITNAANRLNLLTGKASTEGDPAIVEYDYDAIPELTDKLKANGEEYTYLSMSYFLVDDKNSEDGTGQATLEELEFVFKDANNQTMTLTQGLTSVPVRRNYRTNILGNLLTGEIDFDITIDDEFDEPDTGVLYENDLIEALKNALTKVDAGNYNHSIVMDGKHIDIKFDIDADISGVFEYIQNVAGSVFTIDIITEGLFTKIIAELDNGNVIPIEFISDSDDTKPLMLLAAVALGVDIKIDDGEPAVELDDFKEAVTNFINGEGEYKSNFSVQIGSDENTILLVDGMSVEFSKAPTIVDNVEDFRAVLQKPINEIIINSTLGSDNRDNGYTIYNVDRPVTIKGAKGAKVFGTFMVKTDDVVIENLAIQNAGDLSGESSNNRGGIYVFANNVTITNNTITNGLGEEAGLSNAIQLMSPTVDNPLSNYVVKGNKLTGHFQGVSDWASSGIVIAQNYTPGSVGLFVEAIKATDADYQNLLKDNTFENNKIDVTHQDWSSDKVVLFPLYENN